MPASWRHSSVEWNGGDGFTVRVAADLPTTPSLRFIGQQISDALQEKYVFDALHVERERFDDGDFLAPGLLTFDGLGAIDDLTPFRATVDKAMEDSRHAWDQGLRVAEGFQTRLQRLAN
jgi:hypothetical protein